MPLSRGFRLGLGLGLDGTFTGVSLGLAGVEGGRLRGVTLGVLAAGSRHGFEGLTLSAGVVASQADVRGVAFGGLALFMFGGVSGVGSSALAVFAPGTSVGVLAAPVLLVGEVRGVALAVALHARQISGVAIAPAVLVERQGEWNEASPVVRGLSAAVVNWIEGEQRGVAVGLINYAASLHGVQVGLLNWAGNNPRGLRLLPLANAHFD